MPIKLLKVFLVNNFHGWFHGWGASETPGTAAQVMQQTAIIEKVPAQDLRDAEDDMPVGYSTLGIFVIRRLFISLALWMEEEDARSARLIPVRSAKDSSMERSST